MIAAVFSRKKLWTLRFLLLTFFPALPHFYYPLQGLGFYLFRDVGAVYFPAKIYWAKRILEEHTLPQWNPQNFGGSAFLADINFGVLNPFNLIFLLIPNPYWAYTMFQASLCVALAWACFYCFRKYRFGEWAAVLTALSFSVSGIVFSACSNANILGSFLAMPIFCAALRDYAKSWRAKVLISVSVAWPIFASEPQYSYWLCCFFFFFLVLNFLRSRNAQDLAIGAGVGVASFLFSAIQLLPTLGIFYDSKRVVTPYSLESSEFFTFRISRLVELFGPFFYGDISGALPYWGYEVTNGVSRVPLFLCVNAGILLAIALGAFGFTRIPKLILKVREVQLFLFLLVLSIGFRAQIDFYGLFYDWLPFWNKFRSPERLIFPAMFLLLLGMRARLRWLFATQLHRKNERKWSEIGAFSLAIVFFCSSVFFNDEQTRNAMLSLVFYFFALGAFLFARKLGWQIVYFVAFSMILADAWSNTRHLLWPIPLDQLQQAESFVVKKIQDDIKKRSVEVGQGGATRYYPGLSNPGNVGLKGELQDWKQMYGNRNLFYGLSSPVGYSPLEPVGLLQLWTKWSKENPKLMMDFLSVRYVLRSNFLDNPQVAVNTSALPEAWFANETRGFNTAEEGVVFLFQRGSIGQDLAAIVATGESKKYAKGFVTAVEAKSNRFKVKYSWNDTAKSGALFLVLQQRFNRNWSAKLGEQELPILIANGLQLGVEIPLQAQEGKSVLEISYDDPLFRLGAWISGIFLLFLAASSLAILNFQKMKRKK